MIILDLLESQYDRPAPFNQRNAAVKEADLEHVYAEIPLATPF